LTSLVEYLNGMYSDMDRRFVEDLITIIDYVGVGFDTQGKLSLQQMTLEHNHVLTIQSLYNGL